MRRGVSPIDTAFVGSLLPPIPQPFWGFGKQQIESVGNVDNVDAHGLVLPNIAGGFFDGYGTNVRVHGASRFVQANGNYNAGTTYIRAVLNRVSAGPMTIVAKVGTFAQPWSDISLVTNSAGSNNANDPYGEMDLHQKDTVSYDLAYNTPDHVFTPVTTTPALFWNVVVWRLKSGGLSTFSMPDYGYSVGLLGNWDVTGYHWAIGRQAETSRYSEAYTGARCLLAFDADLSDAQVAAVLAERSA